MRCKELTIKGKVCKNSLNCCVHKPNNVCVICLSPIKNPKKLECSHEYCLDCISKWVCLEVKDTCPLCRMVVTIQEERDMTHYCFNNKIVSKVLCYEYYISDSGLVENYEFIDFIGNIIEFDSDYTLYEWNVFLDALTPEIRHSFNKTDLIMYSYYKKYDENDPGIMEYGGSIIYKFKVNLD